MNDLTTFRTGSTADSYTVFCLFEETYTDLVQRMGQRNRQAGPIQLSWHRCGKCSDIDELVLDFHHEVDH